MFSSKEADKKVGGSTISKVIQPGNIVARILDMKLEVPPYDSSAFVLVMNLETEAIGGDFEGLAINKDMPEMGNHAGQVARVQTQQYSYSDYTNKDGNTTTKEDMIFRWLWNFAKEIGVADTLKEKDIQGSTIEEYLENAKGYIVSKERWIHFCIGGSEYENKNGYIQHRLFLPKPEKGKVAYELVKAGVEPKKVMKFDPAVHIKKKKSESVDSFAGRDAGSDLDLD
jgi:hypothetical protein